MNNYKQFKTMNHNIIQVRLIPADYITEYELTDRNKH